MKKFSDKKVILWDFDGVIINSEEIRILGFEKVLEEYPEKEVSKLIEFHKENGGLSRYVKFRYFFEKIRNEEISDDEINELSERFSKIMLEKLPSKKLLIEETINFIKANYRNFEMFIVSGSDEKELKKLCSQLGIDMYFSEIKGSPVPKKQLVKNILEKENFSAVDCVLIGDSINDYEAATFNEVKFYGYNNTSLRERGLNYIEKFE